MSRKRRLVTLGVAVALAAVVAVVALVAVHGGGSEPAERRAAPPVAGELLEGGAFDMVTLRGNVIVVNFWASWCAPCRREIGDLEAAYQATKAQGVEFVGINIRDPDRDKARGFVDGRVTYPSVFDPAGKLSVAFSEFGATTIPATVLIDRQGRVARVLREAVKREQLEPLIAGLATEPRP
jgi:thiol-disulfide isomerase/thioredoxin